MAFDFPDAPVIGDVFTSGGSTYTWTGSVWDLGGVPTAGDFVEKAGDTMTGGIKMVGDGTVGQLWLSQGGTTQNGIIEFRAADGTRAGYFGWGDATNIDLKLEGAAAFRIDGGNIYMQGAGGIHYGNNSAVTSITDFSKGICLYGYGGTSQFGLCITSGTLNLSVQNAGNKIDLNVGTSTQLRVQQGTSNMYSNFHCAGSITSGVANGGTALLLGDGVKIDFSSGCQIRKVYGANDFQFHTNANQTFNFHISGFGDAWVIDTVGSTGNSVNVTAPESLAIGRELGIACQQSKLGDSVDVVKMLAAVLLKVKKLEAEIASLKGKKK